MPLVGLLRHLAEHPSHRVLHVCGRFHVSHVLGVCEQLERYNARAEPPPAAGAEPAPLASRAACRVVGCLPADLEAARAHGRAAVARAPALGALADFVGLTHAPPDSDLEAD